ncbi:hypothetical protein [Streptomyces sp. T028]|uniref:hypothetical protein n=1 Tax=Streptomyces sp. T028 TaxID=3394379 RepID=UPI003A8A94E9
MQGTGRTRTPEERRRRMRRAALGGAALVAIPAVAQLTADGRSLGLDWWIVLSIALVLGAVGAWGGARLGREEAARQDAVEEQLEPGETVLSTYGVWPPSVPPRKLADHEHPPYVLHLTTRRLHFWENNTLSWAYPWREVRLTGGDGPRVRIDTQDGRSVVMTMNNQQALETILLAGRRMSAR